jgi:hypothetical protein
MNRNISALIGITFCCAAISTAWASAPVGSAPPSMASGAPRTTQLSDGSTETDATLPDGSTAKAIKHPDGTVDATYTDAQGNQTLITKHADGTVENKTVPKQP